MARENTTRYAILGMLAHSAFTGYELKQEVAKSVSHFWSESYGQVYPVLHGLVSDGLATVTVEPGERRPNRKLYTITEAGMEEFRAWLRRTPAPSPNRNEMLLKLFFGRHTSDADLMRIVEEYRDRWVTDVATWKAIAEQVQMEDDSIPRDVRNRLFTLRYGALIGAATIAWANEVLTSLRTGASLTDD